MFGNSQLVLRCEPQNSLVVWPEQYGTASVSDHSQAALAQTAGDAAIRHLIHHVRQFWTDQRAWASGGDSDCEPAIWTSNLSWTVAGSRRICDHAIEWQGMSRSRIADRTVGHKWGVSFHITDQLILGYHCA